MISLKSNPWQVHTAHLQIHWKCIYKQKKLTWGWRLMESQLTNRLWAFFFHVQQHTYKSPNHDTRSFWDLRKRIVFTKIWKLLYMFSNDGILRRALLGTWSAWGTLEDWGELEGCTLWRLLETLCSPGWQISTRNYIFSLSLSYALGCPFLASYIYPPVT